MLRPQRMPLHISTFDTGTESAGGIVTQSKSRKRFLYLAAAACSLGAGSLVMWFPESVDTSKWLPVPPDPSNPGYDLMGRPLQYKLTPPGIVDPNATQMNSVDSLESASELTRPNRVDAEESRRIKDEARALDVKLQGRTPEVFKRTLVPELELRIERILDLHREEFLQLLKRAFPDYAIQPDALDQFRDVFQSTLEKRIKLYAAVTGTPYDEIARNPRLLDSLTRQAYFDFVQSLKASHMGGETYNNALKLAGLTHWQEPRLIQNLTTKYGTVVDQSVLQRAALGYPKNPDAFIDQYIHEVQRLQSKYGTVVDQSVLQRAALNYPKNPDAFIDQYIHEVQRLQSKYGTVVDQSVLKSAALNYPKNPDAFIDWYISSYSELIRVPGAKPYIVKEILLQNQMMPINTLRKLI